MKGRNWQVERNVIRLIDEKGLKMDYSQLKRMTEDRPEWY